MEMMSPVAVVIWEGAREGKEPIAARLSMMTSRSLHQRATCISTGPIQLVSHWLIDEWINNLRSVDGTESSGGLIDAAARRRCVVGRRRQRRHAVVNRRRRVGVTEQTRRRHDARVHLQVGRRLRWRVRLDGVGVVTVTAAGGAASGTGRRQHITGQRRVPSVAGEAGPHFGTHRRHIVHHSSIAFNRK